MLEPVLIVAALVLAIFVAWITDKRGLYGDKYQGEKVDDNSDF
jgi:hypothetical protein